MHYTQLNTISEKELKILEAVDESLLRAFVNAHSKTPLEFLYLEAGSIPIFYIISVRRLCYHGIPPSDSKRLETEQTGIS